MGTYLRSRLPCQNRRACIRHGGYIKDRSDGQIIPGQEWESEIIRRLDVADVSLLLVTSDVGEWIPCAIGRRGRRLVSMRPFG
jgi:hypothetical protein